jgi:hypothetical protein
MKDRIEANALTSLTSNGAGAVSSKIGLQNHFSSPPDLLHKSNTGLSFSQLRSINSRDLHAIWVRRRLSPVVNLLHLLRRPIKVHTCLKESGINLAQDLDQRKNVNENAYSPESSPR